MRKIFGRIPPVGNPITVKTSDEIPEFPGSLKTYFLNSGTAALAAGLQIAQAHCKVKTPEVIIPAYCCPDLLSAILYNNMRPVLVDFIPDKPYMDLNGLEEALNENTIAVIAVNFLGIPERFETINQLLLEKQTLLIEDSAQWLPETNEAFKQHSGDLVVYSFGKGKPISLLGGGALLIRNKKLLTRPSLSPSKSSLPGFLNPLIYSLYNNLISPSSFWILDLVPITSIGETKYVELKELTTMDPNIKRFLASNINAYRTRNFVSKNILQYRKLCGGDTFSALANTCETYEAQQLLRYPILMKDKRLKNETLEKSIYLGLGISPLYPKYVFKVINIPAHLSNGAANGYKNAQSFADRLLTLPTHQNINATLIGGFLTDYISDNKHLKNINN